MKTTWSYSLKIHKNSPKIVENYPWFVNHNQFKITLTHKNLLSGWKIWVVIWNLAIHNTLITSKRLLEETLRLWMQAIQSDLPLTVDFYTQKQENAEKLYLVLVLKLAHIIDFNIQKSKKIRSIKVEAGLIYVLEETVLIMIVNLLLDYQR